MAERTLTAQRWLYGAAYVGLLAAIMLWQLVPLAIVPGRIPGPDLLVCVTFAWILRRPHFVPVWLVALVFVMADVIFMRPLGLWAGLVVLASEVLRSREPGTREQPFPVEWALVAGTVLAMTLANRIVLALFLVEQPALGLALFQLIATVLVYPVVVLVTRRVFGVTKMTPSQAVAEGSPR